MPSKNVEIWSNSCPNLINIIKCEFEFVFLAQKIVPKNFSSIVFLSIFRELAKIFVFRTKKFFMLVFCQFSQISPKDEFSRPNLRDYPGGFAVEATNQKCCPAISAYTPTCIRAQLQHAEKCARLGLHAVAIALKLIL